MYFVAVSRFARSFCNPVIFRCALQMSDTVCATPLGSVAGGREAKSQGVSMVFDIDYSKVDYSKVGGHCARTYKFRIVEMRVQYLFA